MFTYVTKDLSRIRHAGNCMEVQTADGRRVRVALNRPDLALELATDTLQGSAHKGGCKGGSAPTRAIAQRRRACEAIDAANRSLSRGRAGVSDLPASTLRAVNRMEPADLLTAVGAMLGRELAQRDRRIAALEGHRPDGAEPARRRANAAIRHAGVVLA